jgi:hypothetical protein
VNRILLAQVTVTFQFLSWPKNRIFGLALWEGLLVQEATFTPAVTVRAAKVKGPDVIWTPTKIIKLEIFPVNTHLSIQVVTHKQ